MKFNILKFLKKNNKKVILFVILLISGYLLYDFFFGKNLIDNFKNDGNNKKKVILFFLPGCVHCEQLMPIWKSVISDYDRKNVKIEEVNANDDREKAELYGLTEFPQIILVENKKKKLTYKGRRTYNDLKRWLENDIFY